MGWLGHGSHRGQGCQAWTAVGLLPQYPLGSLASWFDRSLHTNICCITCTVWVKKNPPPQGDLAFFHFFHKRLRICNRFFTHLLSVPIFTRLQIFIQLSPILTKLCHIKRDYAVYIICAKCPKRAKMRVFRRLRKSLIVLLVVVCGKSLENKHFYNVSKHVRYGMTSPMTSFAE